MGGAWAQGLEVVEALDVFPLYHPFWGLRQILDTEDELQELRSDAVPSEVRDWLASTFTQQARAKGRRAEEKPKFRSIVHAVQAGIFVER